MSDRPVSPLATVPEETPGHGLLAGKKVVVTAAAVLLDADPAEDLDTMRAQAIALRELGAARVLVKGGHLGGDEVEVVEVGIMLPAVCGRIPR